MTTDQNLRLTDGTPAAEHRWHAATARRESRKEARRAADAVSAGSTIAARTAYLRAADAMRNAVQQYINAAGVRGGTPEDTAAALQCCREAYDLDLLAVAPTFGGA